MDSSPAPVLFELSVAAQKVGQVLAAALASTPVGLEDATLLNQLARLEPATPTELASRLGVSPSTLTYRLKGLERRGWVSRTPNPADGRSSLLALAPAGREAWAAALPAFVAALRSVEERIGLEAEDVSMALAAVAAAADAALQGAAVTAR
jgi:DNA-binding MarR family transcriptional regulator